MIKTMRDQLLEVIDERVSALESAGNHDYNVAAIELHNFKNYIWEIMNNQQSAVEPAQHGWLRAIDEALLMHDVGVANADDDYATAKDKLNKLLCVLQDIGAYFAKQESAQAAAEPVSKEWDSLSSIGNRLHNISVEQHYAGNEKLSDELGEFASLLWIWDRTRKPTVPPAIVEPAQAVPVAHMRVMVGCRAPDDCEEYLDVCNPDDVGIDGKAFPVYKVPPAIDDAPRQKAIAHLKSWRINNPVDWVDRRHNSLIHSTLLILEAGNVDQN